MSFIDDATIPGPTDLRCGDRPVDQQTACINDQNTLNAQVRLDNPYMWTHRIVPGILIGGVVGYFIGRAMK